jgi:ABC-2 type transport system ATP-binding protein
MNAISIKNLSKTYSNGVDALKSINIEVGQGEFFALLGPNGAGKSTLISILTSLVKKSSGQVRINGLDIDKDFTAAKSFLGVVPQEFNFGIFNQVLSVLIDQAGYYGICRKKAKIRAEHYLRQLELWDKRHEICRNLSGGMKRRLMIARALMHHPKILILDEPTAGVDVEIRRTMWQFLRKINAEGTTIILTTHYLEEAENLCRQVAIIDNGAIIKNTTISQLLNTLEIESFILYLSRPLHELPRIPGYQIKLIDATTIEVEIPRSHDISVLFETLSQQHISVSRLRNKANRLEELFLQLTNNPQE